MESIDEHQQQQQSQGAPGMNPYVSDAFPSNSTVLRLRGLPYTVLEDDVRKFFEGYDLDGDAGAVVIINQGFHRGEGFVRFKSCDQCADAHRKLNRQCIGARYIELYPSTDAAMQVAQQQQEAIGEQKNFIVRLRGLPFQATEANVYEFFSTIAGSIANVQLCMSFDGRSTGDAFVELTTQEALQSALEKNRSMMGQRYVEVFVSTAHERDVLLTSARRGTRGRGRGAFGTARGRGGQSFGPYATPQGAMMMMMPRPPSQYVVRARGLPYSANEAQIAEFFSDVNIPTQGVHMVYNAQEKPTGEAFVEVMSEQDVIAALRHNGAAMGHRYVEVFRSSGSDMSRLGGGGAAAGGPSGFEQQGGYPMQQPYAVQQPYPLQQQGFMPSNPYQGHHHHHQQQMMSQPHAFGVVQQAIPQQGFHGQQQQGQQGSHGVSQRQSQPQQVQGYSWASDLPAHFQQPQHNSQQ